MSTPRRIFDLVQGCRLLLAGEEPGVQSAVLADLTAMWIAGHVAVGDPKATAEARETVLKMHMDLVRRLIPATDAQYIEPQLKRRTQ